MGEDRHYIRLCWLVDHAADTFNRYRIGADAVTPHKRVNCKEANVPIASFGEKALYHLANQFAEGNRNADSPLSGGINLGNMWVSNGYIIEIA